MRTRKTTLRRHNAPITPNPKRANHANIDLWLQRLSHISQFGLFLFTIGTIYLTVIPLYQKALLDEAIAKKEIEIKNASISLNKIYSEARNHISNTLYSELYFTCSPIGQLINENRINGTDHPPRERLFTYEIKPCFDKIVAKSSGLGHLSEKDRNFIVELVSEVEKSITTYRAEKKFEYASVADRAQKDASFLPPPGKYVSDYVSRFGQHISKDKLNKTILDSRIQAEHAKITQAYTQYVMKQVQRVRTVKWPQVENF